MVLVFRDVSKQVALEQQVQQSQKMDAIGQLAGGVAHDFNNMLGGIMGAAELLKDELANPSRGQGYVDLILKSTLRAAELTGKLLAFSRKSSFTTKALDIHLAIKEAIGLLEHTLDKRIDIQSELLAEKRVVNGDLTQLQSVFLNLGINAGDAMKTGGTLQFKSRTLRLDQAYCDASPFDLTPGQYVQVEVRDSGTGIPAALLPHIFEPFFTTKPVHKGTGLGLAAAFGIINQHNGEITVSSVENQGTVFYVTLPLSAAEEQRIENAEEPVRGRGCILVVDDEEVLRCTAEIMLNHLGYEVMLARNGREAIELFKVAANRIDLVLLDVGMPEMNGHECFDQLIALKSSLPVILCSGSSDDAKMDKMTQRGVAGFIQKPYSTLALSRIVAASITA
jgi:nitrogen-specific signal transduction histidine kinase/CheY-like chemotaxis protein